MRRVVLIDGKNFSYRHFYTHRTLSYQGFPTGLLYGGLSGLASLVKRLPDTPFCWVWDGAGITWRHKLAPKMYKAHRHAERWQLDPDVKRLHRQIPALKRFLAAGGYKCFEIPRLECDDLLGILAHEIVKRNLFDEVVIHSSDRDFYQFIGKRIKVLKGLKDGELLWASQKEIEREFGVPIEKWTQLRAIIGDKSDNIPSIFAGVGPKTAAKFINDGLDVTAKSCKLKAVVRKKEIDFKGNWDRIQLNYKLCQIPTDPKSACFDQWIQLKLNNTLDGLTRRSFLRDAKIVDDDEAYNAMLLFFARYGMENLVGSASVLWGIQ